MGSDRGQTVGGNEEVVTFMQERSQGRSAPIGKTNINEINKRNEEQDQQEKKAAYRVVGIVIFAIVLIVAVLYFFS